MRRVGTSLTALAAIALVATGGCGSSSSKKAAPSGGGSSSSQQAGRQDAAAKADARNLLVEVETCFTTTQDYSQCSTAAHLQAAGSTASNLPIGKGPGQVEVSKATATDNTIVAHSKSGTDFTATRDPSGAIKRACSKPGSGGCPAGGAW